MTEGIILAGGHASRAGTNKMMLTFRGKPLIKAAVDGMRPHVQRIVVVTGHYHDEIARLFRDDPLVEIVKNDRYDEGMFTSVKTGVRSVAGDFFILPGDIPAVDKRTYEALLGGEGIIRVPVFAGRRGHPILLDKTLKDPLLAMPDAADLKSFRDSHPVEYIETDDEGVLVDVDTLADHERLTRFEKRGECS